MDQKAQRVFIRKLAEKYNLDLDELCANEAMSWKQVRALQDHPLATIGAHSVNHYALGLLSEAEAVLELEQSRTWIAEETGYEPDFFCYPYGDERSAGPRDFDLAKRAGYKAAVTTRKGLLYDAHGEHLSALPRVSLNGDYQALKYIDLYLSGAPFALWNGFRKLNIA
jgi:peptidoglycan/xylan/chitin deacetylase (PgdA/CDA1 family)